MNRNRPVVLLSVAMLLVLCSCTKEDQKLWRVGIPYSSNVWVDYVFDEAKPDASIVIINPYANSIKGQHDGGVRGNVAYSTWTTENGVRKCGWEVMLRATPQSFQIGGAGRFGKGRFLVLTDPHASKPPVQIDIPVPGGMTTGPEVRKWLDGIRQAGVTLGEQPGRGDAEGRAPHP